MDPMSCKPNSKKPTKFAEQLGKASNGEGGPMPRASLGDLQHVASVQSDLARLGFNTLMYHSFQMGTGLVAIRSLSSWGETKGNNSARLLRGEMQFGVLPLLNLWVV